MLKFLLWPLSILLALSIGGLTYVYLNSSFPSQLQGQLLTASTENVVVAANDITLRRSILESDLMLQEMSIGSIPEGAARSINEVTGMMATSDIFSGEAILTQQIAVAGAVIQQIALTIPDDKVLVSIPLRSQLISTGLVKPGDRVDLFGTFVVEEVLGDTIEADTNSRVLLIAENAAETVAVLRELEVHAIIIEPNLMPKRTNQGDRSNTGNRRSSESSSESSSDNNGIDREKGDGDNDRNTRTADPDGVFESNQLGEQAILVALDSQDSVVVNHLLDTAGMLDIVLRSPDDTQLAEVTNVDIFYIADRYGIELLRDNALIMTEDIFQANTEDFIFTDSQPSPEFLAGINK